MKRLVERASHTLYRIAVDRTRALSPPTNSNRRRVAHTARSASLALLRGTTVNEPAPSRPSSRDHLRSMIDRHAHAKTMPSSSSPLAALLTRLYREHAVGAAIGGGDTAACIR